MQLMINDRHKFTFNLTKQIFCLCQLLFKVQRRKKQGDCKPRNETETKRNETKETQQKRNKIKEKRNEAKQDTTETKRNKKNHMNKKTKQTLTKRFFLHETTIHKMSVAD